MAHPMLSPPPPDGVVPEIRGVVPKPAKQRWFKPLLMSLPSQVRYFLSLIAFWPTAAIARIFAWAMPQNRRVWDRVDDHVILGAAPFFRSELEDLYHKQRVRGIVNMCREWNYHVDWVRIAVGHDGFHGSLATRSPLNDAQQQPLLYAAPNALLPPRLCSTGPTASRSCTCPPSTTTCPTCATASRGPTSSRTRRRRAAPPTCTGEGRLQSEPASTESEQGHTFQ